MPSRGMVAAGHPATAEAAASVLAAGGNAFDAAVAGLLAACVAEPMLASLGGGGFLLARPAAGVPQLFDFFAQTPRSKHHDGLDFYAIEGDFGDVVQEFHVGLGSIATPGMVKGLFRVARDLGRLPMIELIQPAVDLARGGVVINQVQAYAAQVLAPIVSATDGSRRLFAGDPAAGRALVRGSCFRLPEMADVLEALAREGADLFYRGELARSLADACRDGGYLDRDDLSAYRVAVRKPLAHTRRGAHLLLNPPPSLGGSLILFALELYDAAASAATDVSRVERLVDAMAVTSRARRETRADTRASAGASGRGRSLLGRRVLASYREVLAQGLASRRGTTHVSVVDAEGNVASTSVSNGEGCGWVLPGTGIMLNNMLGEEDLAKDGFGRWPENRRLASMMCPTVVETAGGRLLALGSGGSNRIRSAILQVLLGMLDDDLSPRAAVARPRVHLENDRLDAEPGIEVEILERLRPHLSAVHQWDAPNMFFGGVHLVERNARTGRCRGAGDPRRGGVAREG